MITNSATDQAPALLALRSSRPSATWLASWFFSLLTGAFLLGLVIILVGESIPVWKHSGFAFVTGVKWFYRDHVFGGLPMIYGTVGVSLVALGLAVPLGVASAICIAEFLPPRFRILCKIAVELLAGIPSVVYGLLGILFLRDWVYHALSPWDPLSGDTLLTAGVLVGVMILPTVVSLTDDALRGVPALQRQAARGLGLNASEVVWSVVLPQASSGIVAAVLLALGRSLGEMIAVFLVVGRQDNQWPESLLSLRPWISAGQTLSSKLGGSETNIAYGDPVHWGAMMSLGLVLLLMVAGVTSLAFRFSKGEPHA